MRQAGVATAPERSRRERAWVDFGVDESWERAAPRRASGPVAPARDTAETPSAWSHVSAVSTPAPRPGAGIPGRRTVTIRGHGAERDLDFAAHRPTRRPATRPHERPGFKPDRAALWAILLGIFLVLVAATSSHAATLRSHAATLRPAARVQHVALVRPASRIAHFSRAQR